MSAVKINLIRVNLNAGNVTLACHIALLDSIEYDKVVNLDNAYAKVRERVTPTQWRSALAVLAKQGKYQSMSGEFNGSYGTLI